MSKIETFVDESGKLRFRFVAANGKIVASSQAYKSKASCLKGIAAAVKVAIDYQQRNIDLLKDLFGKEKS